MRRRWRGWRDWSPFKVLVVVELAVFVLILVVAWWPSSGPNQEPLGFVDGVKNAVAVAGFALPFVALYAAARSATHRTAREVFGAITGLLAGVVVFLLAAFVAASRVEDSHEA